MPAAMLQTFAIVAVLAGCATELQQVKDGTTACGPVDAGPAREFRHAGSEVTTSLGEPRHRGADLIASTTGPQFVEGWIAYTAADKALEDEDVDVLACSDGAWQPLGTVRTNEEGHFSLAVQLAPGLHDLYVSVAGDRSGVAMLGYVGDAIVISDVDGTLTASESAFIETLLGGENPGAQPGAADMFAAAAARGLQVVYLTARGNQYTEATRSWLASRGFPKGPLRLASSFATLPGDATAAFKSHAIEALGVPVVAAIGNRASDITAYAAAGTAADRIYIKLPEYQSEVQGALAAGEAKGFNDYASLQGLIETSW